MRAARVDYPWDTAPTGIVTERLSHGELEHALTDEDAALDIQKIGFQAWYHSDWLRQLADANDLPPTHLALRAFNPLSREKIIGQYARIKISAEMGKRVVYWFGETFKPFPEDWDGSLLNLPDNVSSYFPQGWPQGFAKIEQQGGRGGRLSQAAQRLANVGVWACLHDLNVLPEHQGKGLGTAIAYSALSEQPQRLPSSLYTPLANAPMRAWAEKYGYHLRDEYVDNDLLGGVSVDFGHYVADSVGAARERMEQMNPWLTKAKRKSMLSRVLDEAVAEAISRNPKG